MTRDQFDKLSLMEQIEFINSQLSEGITVTNICKNIGIGRSTIRDRFGKLNYFYDKNDCKYIFNGNVRNDVCVTGGVSSDGLEKLDPSKEKIMPGGVVSKEMDKPFKTGDMANNKDMGMLYNGLDSFIGNDIGLDEKINVLANAVFGLMQDMKEVKEDKAHSESMINTINTSNTKLVVPKFEGATNSRAYRMYDDIQKRFKAFCRANPEHKVQDLLALALTEFMNKYN